MIIDTYIQNFKSNGLLKHPNPLIAVSVICSETSRNAGDIALSSLLWEINIAKGEGGKGIPSMKEVKKYIFNKEEEIYIKERKKQMIIGNPEEVKKQLLEIKKIHQVNEIMIVTNTHNFEDRLKSYKLIAEEVSGTMKIKEPSLSNSP